MYNIDMAQRYRTIVVMEGATDVWGFGPMGVAQFSKDMTYMQKALISKFCGHCALVLLNDTGKAEKESANKTHKALKGRFANHGIAVVTLEHGDPGNLDRAFLREFVKDEAAKQGVHVSYKRR